MGAGALMSWRSATFLVWALLALSTVVLACLAAMGSVGIGNPFVPVRTYLSGHRVARVATVLGWMWLGWHFFAR
jgi:hypothetical protein